MNNHRYLCGYLAGVFFPTVIFPVMFTVLNLGNHTLERPFPVERIVIFPFAFVPAGWGLWNMLWVATCRRTRLPLGAHGAILPFLLMPAGAVLAKSLGVVEFGKSGVIWFQSISAPYPLMACGFAVAVFVYYLAWKYIVGFVNRVLGIA